MVVFNHQSGLGVKVKLSVAGRVPKGTTALPRLGSIVSSWVVYAPMQSPVGKVVGENGQPTYQRTTRCRVHEPTICDRRSHYLLVKLFVIRVEPSSVTSQRVVFPMRHRREVHPEVVDRQRIGTEVDDGDVAETPTLLFQRGRILAGAGDVEYQGCVQCQTVPYAESPIGCFGRDPHRALRERETDTPAARRCVEVDPAGDVLAEVVGHRRVERVESEAFPGGDLAVKEGILGGQRATAEVDGRGPDGPRRWGEYVLLVGHRSCSPQNQNNSYKEVSHVEGKDGRSAAWDVMQSLYAATRALRSGNCPHTKLSSKEWHAVAHLTDEGPNLRTPEHHSQSDS